MNEILGLPRLEERSPLDALIRESTQTRSTPWSKRPDDDDPPFPPGGAGADSPEDGTWKEEKKQHGDADLSFDRIRQAMRRTFETHPERLMVYINGRPWASQPVEDPRQIITLWPDEEMEVIEVLSEEGVRLACMDVNPFDLKAVPKHGRVRFSGGREIQLHVFVDHAGQGTVQVTYSDPSAEAVVVGREKTWWSWLAPLVGWKREPAAPPLAVLGRAWRGMGDRQAETLDGYSVVPAPTLEIDRASVTTVDPTRRTEQPTIILIFGPNDRVVDHIIRAPAKGVTAYELKLYRVGRAQPLMQERVALNESDGSSDRVDLRVRFLQHLFRPGAEYYVVLVKETKRMKEQLQLFLRVEW